MFLDYVSMCQHTNTEPLFSHAVFGKLVKRAFPGIKTNRKGPRGQSKQHYTLLCRAKPTQKQCDPVPSSVPAPAPSTIPTIKKETIPQPSTCQQQQPSQMRGMPNYSSSVRSLVECNFDEEFFHSTNNIHHECPDHTTMQRDTRSLTCPIECLTNFISPPALYENNLLYDLQECGFTSSHDSISSFYSSLDSLPQADLLPSEEFHARPSTVGHSYPSVGQLPKNPTIYEDNSTSLQCVSRHSDYYSNTFCYRCPSSERSSFDEQLALGDLPLLDQSPGIPAYAPHPPCSSNWIGKCFLSHD